MTEKNESSTAVKMERTPVYVKKSQQYEDLRSSAASFMIIGAALLILAALCWLDVIRLPVAGSSRYITQSMMTAFGIISCMIAVSSHNTSKTVHAQMEAEDLVSEQLMDWFLSQYTAEALDQQIIQESGTLLPEEMFLSRYDLIQDILITRHDIADQAYVDTLAEEIYDNLYE